MEVKIKVDEIYYTTKNPDFACAYVLQNQLYKSALFIR